MWLMRKIRNSVPCECLCFLSTLCFSVPVSVFFCFSSQCGWWFENPSMRVHFLCLLSSHQILKTCFSLLPKCLCFNITFKMSHTFPFMPSHLIWYQEHKFGGSWCVKWVCDWWLELCVSKRGERRFFWMCENQRNCKSSARKGW